ncbi:MAG TPA: ABC transporter ATP-binding protein [Spirochaetia bacterium]|nr:ABC transporter ATP-binding protein [Spirochaetia bacterium]
MAMVDLVDIGFSYFSGNLLDAALGVANDTFSIEHFTLHIPHGQVTVLLGPSGCGKSTLLKLIAGLTRAREGEILFDGRVMDKVKPGERRIGMVFQDRALYPHLDAQTNITSWFFFRKKTPALDEKKAELFNRTAELLEVKLDHLLRRRPPRLSGGEQQRVSLGRCITREPSLLLLDEPFSNLDAPLREQYRVSLRKLLHQFGVTTVYVTHDQREAMLLADKLVLITDGRIVQYGTPREVYDNPGNLFVAEFLNDRTSLPAMNFFPGETIGNDLAGTTVGVRPQDVLLSARPRAGAGRATVLAVRALPLENCCEVTTGFKNVTLTARAENAHAPTPGTEVGISFRKYFVFNSISEQLERIGEYP